MLIGAAGVAASVSKAAARCLCAQTNWGRIEVERNCLSWPLFSSKRFVSRGAGTLHPYRRVVGHRLEYIIGKHTSHKHNPPKVPLHPILDADRNMDLFLTYRDLKLRWRRTIGPRKRRMQLARRWKAPRFIQPLPKPTCVFVSHNRQPSHKFPRKPTTEQPPRGKLDLSQVFCIFKSSQLHQHKVTVGDLVQAERLRNKQAGDKIVFGTVLLAGSRDWTIIGKPTVPYAKVKATVEQQTLAREQLSFRFKRARKQSRFLRIRHYVTMLRIDEIVIDPTMEADPPPPKPLRLLDLWSNRFLYPEELRGAKMKGDGRTPIAAELYDGTEHQSGSYHNRGLTTCYRWTPDPQATHWTP